MTQAQNGNTVKVHYTGKLESGEIFDSSEGREPLEFTIGQGQMISGFDAAVIGMNAGETKTRYIHKEVTVLNLLIFSSGSARGSWRRCLKRGRPRPCCRWCGRG